MERITRYVWRGNEIFGGWSKVKSDQVSMGNRWRTSARRNKRGTQKLLLLRCLLGGGCLDFGEEPEEENPQGPKFVNRRLSSGWDRFVGVTYPKTKHNKNMSSAPRHSDEEKRNEGYALRSASVTVEEYLPRRVVR
jgi:hypothetical protein